jgi:hypothetical protein
MGDDPVLYRTFVVLDSLGSPGYSVYRVDPVDRTTRSTPDHVTSLRSLHGHPTLPLGRSLPIRKPQILPGVLLCLQPVTEPKVPWSYACS